MADIEELTGQPFDAAARIDRLFGANPQERWDGAQAVHRAAEANAIFVLVDGVGHDRRKPQIHATHFFASVLAHSRRGAV